MNKSLPKLFCSRRERSVRILPILVLAGTLTGCVYQFGHASYEIPSTIRSVAVEAIYDTSRELIPHEVLWSAIQRHIAKSGHLRLVAQSEADALLRVWLYQASLRPTGTPNQELIAKEPTFGGNNPGKPEDYRNLHRAGTWTTEENISLSLTVELHDLYSKKLLKQQSYQLGTNFKSLRPVTLTPTSSSSLQYAEAMEAKVKEISEQVSASIINDFGL